MHDDADIFAAALSEALFRVQDDGTLPPDAVQVLLDAILATDAATRHRVAFEPERYLGDFADLPERARQAIVEAIVACDRQGLRTFDFNALHALLLRGLWRVRNDIYRLTRKNSRSGRALRDICDVVAYSARKGPSFAADLLFRSRHARRVRGLRNVRLLDVLLLATIKPFDLAVAFAANIPQPTAARAYWQDAQKRQGVGRVLGLDFLPTDDGCWYVESNVHPAVENDRSALYERDPMCLNIVEFTREQGYKRLMILDNTSAGIDPKMKRDYIAEARRVGLELSLPTLPNVPGPTDLRCYGIPDDLDDDTFVVRIRPYPISVDHILGSKRATDRLLRKYLAQTVEPDLRLPATGEGPPALLADDHRPYPNVVYKLPDIEQGRGVYFLKAKSAEHAKDIVAAALRAPRRRTLEERVQYSVTSKEGFYQPFIASRLLEGRHLYKVRALVLVAPGGVRFLSAHRLVSAAPVPDELPYGVVTDLRPFLLNTSAGGVTQRVPPDEEQMVARAAEAVGRGFAWAMERAFRVGPA